MNKLFLAAVLLLVLLTACSDNAEVDVISLNIRFDNPADGKNAWPNRSGILSGFIKERQADIIGLQEALWHQYAYLDSCLTDYSSIGFGRDDGEKKGEMTPIFFRDDRFSISDSGNFWLSETPAIPGSRGWGAALPRIVTWARLCDRQSGQSFYFFNTHFSHMSDSARIMSARVLTEKVYEIAGDDFFIITGDFNMTDTSKAYETLVSAFGGLFNDTYSISDRKPEGPGATFNGFRSLDEGRRIDYIFCREGADVISCKTYSHLVDSVFISDHWPVNSVIEFSY